MFDEEEPGKPKNWGCTIAIISLMMMVNITIFVVCRVLLDSEDEYDEPILQGKLREDVTYFLGIFSMTFCFGCCCCFCCGGAVFRWIFQLLSCRCSCLDVSKIWSGAIKRRHSSRRRRASGNLEEVVIDDTVPTVSSQVMMGSKRQIPYKEQGGAYSNRAFDSLKGADNFELTRPSALVAAAPPADFEDHRLVRPVKIKPRSMSVTFC